MIKTKLCDLNQIIDSDSETLRILLAGLNDSFDQVDLTDVYKRANPLEALASCEPLMILRWRTLELLEEYPEHPTLL